jgi:hypothetical protein
MDPIYPIQPHEPDVGALRRVERAERERRERDRERRQREGGGEHPPQPDAANLPDASDDEDGPTLIDVRV